MEKIGKHLKTSAKSSLPSYGQERPIPSEAATLVIRMLSAYPETLATCSEEYLATLAETLCQFPRVVATAAASPVHGVPKKYPNFKPSAAQVAEWCKTAIEPDDRAAKRHDAISETLERRREFDKGTQADRVAHVERLRAAGKLTFSSGPEDDRRKPWYQTLTVEAAQAFLDANNHDKVPF